MKILVVSLLRLGDIVMSTPVLRGLQEKYPHADIHVLINQQFSEVTRLIPSVAKVHLFDRHGLQKSLGDADRPLFEAYEKTKALLVELNAEDFDLVINLTHNKLSGWLVSLIESKSKVGLSFDEQGKPSFGSAWFRYLNSQGESDGEEVFHYTDIFHFALDLDPRREGPVLAESALGKELTEKRVNKDTSFALVQALTSDVKKNWGLANFTKTLEIFGEFHPRKKIFVLGAPFEEEVLRPWVSSLQAKNINVDLAICGLEEAFSLLKRADGLLTCDTSIKHLAAAAGTPVVELSLGSSDFRRTGIYSHGSYILQSKEACAPCQHSKPCHRSEHFCARRISPECVALVFNQVFTGNTHQIRTIAEEYKEDVEILCTEIRSAGFRTAYSVVEPFTEASVGRWVDLYGWKLYLQSLAPNSDVVGEFGSEAQRLSRLLRKVYPEISQADWRYLLEDFEKQAEKLETRVAGYLTGLQGLRRSFENPEQMKAYIGGLINFREKLKSSPLLSSFRSALDFVIEDDISPPFVRIRRIHEAIHEINERAQIELKVIRTLQRQMEQDI